VDLASLGTKVVPSLNGADLSFMNSVTGSICRAKSSNILQNIRFEKVLLAVGLLGSGKIMPKTLFTHHCVKNFPFGLVLFPNGIKAKMLAEARDHPSTTLNNILFYAFFYLKT